MRSRFAAGSALLSIWLLLAAAVVLSGCKEEAKQSLQTETAAFTKEGTLRILSAESDTLRVELDIEIADTDYETQTGLMYRREMKDSQGMLFVFQEEAPHSFYMKNTLLALDILFINKELKVATIHPNAQPLDEGGIPSRVPVQYVLEVKAGLADRWGVQPGDRIEFNRISK